MLTENWKLETQTGKSPISIEFPMAEGFAVNTRRVFYEICMDNDRKVITRTSVKSCKCYLLN